MKLTKVKKILSFSLISALLISMNFNVPAMAIKDNELNPQAEQVPLWAIKQKLNNTGKLDKEFIDINHRFNAFPEGLTIDLALRDVDIPSILRIIAEEGGMNIVIDESVMGFISADLKGISLNEAMHIILTSEELESRVDNNTIFVASRPAMAKKGMNRRFVKTFKLNHSNAVEIAELLEASIFNKGYKVDESAASSGGGVFQAVANDEDSDITGSSTGQSQLIDSKTIRARVETLVPGENYNDSAKLASTIKLQAKAAKTENIQVSNNDGGAIVIPDTRTNSILVAGLRKDIMLAEEAVKYLDQPLKQVLIEVSLLELTKTDTDNLGLGVTTQDGSISGGFNALSNDFSPHSYLTSAANKSGIYLNTISNLSSEIGLRINALLENKKGKLLANPNIIALNNSESLIKITDQVVSKIETTVTQTATTYTSELADVGIVLNILPKIGDDGYVTMRIRPSISTALDKVEIGAFQSGAAAISITPISTREILLQDVRVKTGETLAIAGITKEDETETVGKIPLLSSLPLVGKLFKNKEFKKIDTELVILITPKIIDDVAYNSI